MRRWRTAALLATCAAVVLLLGSLLVGLRAPPEEAAATVEAPPLRPPPGRRIRVEVLNASGTPGVARDAMRALRDGGFDVVYFGNARGFAPDTSLVLDRVGTPGAAREVAEALGIDRVAPRPDTTLYLEVTVVLGRDWRRGGQSPAVVP